MFRVPERDEIRDGRGGRDEHDWVAVTESPLPVDVATAWVVLPRCGAFVVFGGTVRDHADGRSGVTHLDYEAYIEHAEGRLAEIVAAAGLGRARDRVAVPPRIGEGGGRRGAVLVAAGGAVPPAGVAADAMRPRGRRGVGGVRSASHD